MVEYWRRWTYLRQNLIRYCHWLKEGQTNYRAFCMSFSFQVWREFVSRHIILDTPGQIEIFTWSASGAIITDAVASSFPTVIAYIVDTPRCTAPATFMSNMLYACRYAIRSRLLFYCVHFTHSILYKTKLPFILVFNKTDVESHKFALEWMEDFEAYQGSLCV